MFCDICDMFDQHETEDCPQQEMSDSPPPSQHHGDRNAVRPYCDICEGKTALAPEINSQQITLGSHFDDAGFMCYIVHINHH